ncbi:hypothetical protein NBRC116494_21640 [Aurantivibrio plasticivorans]
MNDLAEALYVPALDSEWDRVELLARCLLMSRAGVKPDDGTIATLKELQHQVEALRTSHPNPWQKLPVENLSPLAMDVLAVIYAVEAQPRVGLLLQDLNNTSQPFPTLALVQVLLALDNHESKHLYQLAGEHGELQQRGLIQPVSQQSDQAQEAGSHAFTCIRANRFWLGTLLDWPLAEITPPGSFRVKQQACWDDLVLPQDRISMLHEYMMWLRHKHTVVDQWGGRKVGGPVALFSGPSGTGKTFAASVIAGELGWPLYRVDLARLVSKYIGETEKNIGRLFDSAHGKQLVLQFDEVDALMSKRGEVKEARDRYANMEVSYLLSRIEEHDGPCILTTNLRSHIDKAFIRRFQAVVEFPRPNEAARALLWRRMLPPQAPISKNVDFEMLARSVSLTGGNIRNAALHAAYLAAEQGFKGGGTEINLEHIAIGVWRELTKDKAQIPTSDLGVLVEYLPENIVDQGAR